MSKGNKSKTSKTRQKTLGKVKYEPDTISVVKNEDKQEIGSDLILSNDKDIRTVTVNVDFYEHIVPFFANSDVQTKCKYLERTVGETCLLPVTDNPKLSVDESFTFKVNAASKKDIDNLISSPILFTVLQHAGTGDPIIYEQLLKIDELRSSASAKSFDSIVSMYEAFTGETVDVELTKVKKSKSKKKVEKKTKEKKPREKEPRGSRTSRTSRSSRSTIHSQQYKLKKLEITESAPNVPPPLTYGMCTLDLLPLFYGKSSFSESLNINPCETYNDERMSTYKLRPQITVTVSIDKPLCYNNPVILNVTMESIYNLPLVMKPVMDYKVCTMLPMENSHSEPIVFTNPTYTIESNQDVMKCWPGIRRIGPDANTTKYRIDMEHIKNTTDLDDVESCFKEISSRIQFNVLKRNLLLKDGMEAFCHQVQHHRKILVEIFMSIKERATSIRSPSVLGIVASKDNRGTSRVSIRSSQESKSKINDSSKRKSSSFLHLMTFVDLSSLLYPGVTKTRVASPLICFNLEEAFRHTGATDSYFTPKLVQDVHRYDSVRIAESIHSDKRSEKSKKKDKSSASKSSKSSKITATKAESPTAQLKEHLPPKPETPPDPEPIVPVYNEFGKQCFLIMEIELSKPIFEKRSLEDLSDRLDELIEEKSQSPSKIVLTHKVTKDYYREVLNEIIKDIYDKYKQYMLTKELQTTVAEKGFINYLETVGAYQTYMTSIKGAISMLTVTKFQFDETDKKSPKLYQNFIGEVFIYLVSEMNDTLNRLICSGLEPVVAPTPKPADKLLIYAKEAVALGKFDLADRYFLERICYDETEDPNVWFDYAIFNLEIHESGKAYECALEALAKKPTHKHSHILLGALLEKKGQKDDAETCFLKLMVHQPRWVEGWVVLYLFYQKYGRYEGMDMSMDMVKKYRDDQRVDRDYFDELDDLLWTQTICPDTIFFRTAVLLLKMRLFEWVEMALAQELQQNFGTVQYLLSAVSLYQGFFEQALEHIQQAKAYCGSNQAISSLSGHCLFALNRHVEAKEDYYHALESLDRPNDLHLVYINCAQILEKSGDHQEARKLILLACKYSPTHYTWFRAGELYEQENDLLSAEECFSEANFKDNRCPEYWGHLTLINLQLNRPSEAELCYSQAIKNNLEGPLLEKIKTNFKRYRSKEVQT